MHLFLPYKASLLLGPFLCLSMATTNTAIANTATPVYSIDALRDNLLRYRTNKQAAMQLKDKLYNNNVGAIREFLHNSKELDDSLFLSRFHRTWAYTQGIALEQEVRYGDLGRARSLVLWLESQVQRVRLSNGKNIFGGWFFSQNTKNDTFRDPRLITGANCWAVAGLGTFVASNLFDRLAKREQGRIRKLYISSLYGLLHHQREDGLMTAGWTPKQLREVQGKKIYYKLLDRLGYGGGQLVKAANVVTEHNLDMLAVLNRAIQNAELVGLQDINPFLKARDQLRTAIFFKLFNNREKRFVTGRVMTKHGEIASPHTAADNAIWLALSVVHGELTAKQVDQLAHAIDWSNRNFLKDLSYGDQSKKYFGAHYFLNSFEDPYIKKSELQEKLYQLEITAGFILSLNKFADAHPQHAMSVRFRKLAWRIWIDMQRFVQDHGFPYSTTKIRNLMTPLQSATSVIWYLDTRDYYSSLIEIPQTIELPGDVLFALNKAELTQQGKNLLQKVAYTLTEHPLKMHIDGHTCNIGSTHYNQRLSEKRAYSVREHLVSAYNLAPERITHAGKGELDPAYSNETEETRRLNRRVVFHLPEGSKTVRFSGIDYWTLRGFK